MKKIVMLLIAAFCAFGTIGAYAADLDKALSKELNKEYKKKLKQYKKEKWQVVGSRTLEVSLLMHYKKLNNPEEDANEIIGMSRAKSKNNGYQMAANNAYISYANQAGSALKGRVMSDVFADGATMEGEFDHFFAAYERLVEREIKGEMIESFALIRTNPESYEYQVFFIVSENAAAKARMRALKNALQESEAAQRYADQLSKFVNEGFKQQ